MSQLAKNNIAIIGAGKIGKAIAYLMANAGYSVVLGSRHSDQLNLHMSNVIVKDIVVAARNADIIVLAIPYDAIEEIISVISLHVADKLIIDVTNPFTLSAEGKIASSLPAGMTAGARIAALLPKSKVARAFTHIMDELLVTRGTTQSGFWAMAYATDELDIQMCVESLIVAAGFVPVFIGDMASSGLLDPGGVLFPHMFTPAEMREKLLI